MAGNTNFPMAMGRGAGDIPSLQELQKFRVMRDNAAEGVRQTLYDFQTYTASSGHTLLQFFQVPMGQGGKTYADTNMTQAGTLPTPQAFLVESIEIYFFPGVLNSAAEDTAAPLAEPQFINDVAALNKTGFLEFNVSSKNYLREAPLGVFPPKTRLTGGAAYAESIAGSTASSMLSSMFATFGGRPYFLKPPVLLESTVNFSVTLNWPTAIVLPSNVDARIGVKLDGIFYRAVQ